MNYFNYYTEIEETFVRRRGRNLLLSPIDWALIEGWQERGIPLHVALRAIENVFDGFDKKPKSRTIKGLLYCREEIEAQYEEWQRSQAGKSDAQNADPGGGALSREEVVEHISKLIDGLKDVQNISLKDDLDRSIARLQQLGENLGEDLELVDHSLSDIENFLENALLSNSDPVHLKKAEKEVSDQLKPYKSGMEADAYKNTFSLMLLKRLREDNNIPRLSLFYL